MRHYVHELTPTEEACGVTLEQVADLLPKVLVRNGKVYLPTNTPPALAGSVARCALGQPARYVGTASIDYPIYAADGGVGHE